jgi:DNA mismatch repair protein MutS
MDQHVFELDKQTRDDLSIFPNSLGDPSILAIFDNGLTIGGKEKLRDIFRAPLTNAAQIEQRVDTIKYFQNISTAFKPDRLVCDYIEYYLKLAQKPTSVSKIKAIERKAMHFIFNTDNDFYTITQGINNTFVLLKDLHQFIVINDYDTLPSLLQVFHSTINDTLKHPDFLFIKPLLVKENLSAIDIARADHLFRYVGYERIKTLLDITYQLDIFIAVGNTGSRLGFTLPVVNKSGVQVLNLRGAFHPFVKAPVSNDIEFNSDKNICFFTGANMAGKSTFLKSIGISVFLSQLGFPVPAAYMETSVFDGLITTINLADNINQGNSHFYTEVSRVKHVANLMHKSQNVVVIFDELFRGTNVKDAYDASLSIISAFSKLKKGFFIVSTHIVEVAHDLIDIKNINFKYMQSTFDNDMPKYSYKVMDGITEERLGMWIVKNEGIVEIIERLCE